MAKQIILAAHFPGVDHTTVWSDPQSGSQIDYASFAHLARTAERGLFDMFFLAEGLRLREERGRIHDLDVVGCPDVLTVLTALAAVTTRLGLAGAVNTTWGEPYELARRLATLDHLSGGRAGWNVVTSADASIGKNFRRGGFLEDSQRYERAAEFVRATRVLWDSWPPDAIAPDPAEGVFTREADPGAFGHRGPQFDIEGHFTVPRSPQGHPVIIHADDSEEGRDFSAATADVVFTRHGIPRAGQAFYQDIKSRLARFGRSPEELKVLPAATFVLGDSEADARECAEYVRRQQVSPQSAISLLEQVWNRDLSGYDPDGPLPAEDPDTAADPITTGCTRQYDDRLATARTWRAIAREKDLSIRELVIEVTGRRSFVGTPARVAEQIDRYVQADVADGFILVPQLIPGGLDVFVATVVPLLQERGVFRTAYAADTLRGNLGLGPACKRGTCMIDDPVHPTRLRHPG